MKPTQTKNIIYSLLLVTLVVLVYHFRRLNTRPNIVHLQGITMGVIQYQVKYKNDIQISYQQSIDSLLADINQSLSTYIIDSEISRFNQGKLTDIESDFFYEVLCKSWEVYQKTQGAFDPTVFPLVKAWGFGPEKLQTPNARQVDSLLALVGFDKITFTHTNIVSNKIGVSLDFSAIAKGYAVDRIAALLERKQIKDYLVEIGGELRCAGKNAENQPWRVGIQHPRYKEKTQTKPTTIALMNRAIATSGNYENYYIRDGKKYSHTIDPKTGYSVTHNLLSASVVAKDCITADAYATALMVMGTEKSVAFLARYNEIEAFLIFSDGNKLGTYRTEGFPQINK